MVKDSVLKNGIDKLLIVRIKYDDGKLCFGNACPCVFCLRVIKDYNVKRIYYSVDNDSDDYDYDVPIEMYVGGKMILTSCKIKHQKTKDIQTTHVTSSCRVFGNHT